MSVQVRLDERVITQSLRTTGGPVGRGLFGVATRVEARAKRKAPVNTGRLRSSIKKRVVNRGGEVQAIVSADVKYAAFVHEGTGIYGPRRRRITPRAGAFLVFTPKGTSDVVFARTVAGIRPNPFLADALREVIR